VTSSVVSPRAAAALLDFQMWCWGQDIVRPEGNLLLGHAERWRPDGGRGSSHYRVRLDASRALILWGFAVAVDSPNAPYVVLRRHGFTPRVLDRERVKWPIARPEALPRGERPRSAAEAALVHEALAAAVGWITEYERGVRTSVGAAWRQECLRRRPRELRRRLRCAPDALVEAWSDLAATTLPSLLPVS